MDDGVAQMAIHVIWACSIFLSFYDTNYLF
jgi:hypothetical protein